VRILSRDIFIGLKVRSGINYLFIWELIPQLLVLVAICFFIFSSVKKNAWQKLLADPGSEKLANHDIISGTLTKSQSSGALGWGDQKQWPFFLFYLQGAITHKHLFLKLFYIRIFFDHGIQNN
jgi:hypothetical protein